jgi:mRNA-degrading endonuclease toxin of MazEF toxin-antitoxin module
MQLADVWTVPFPFMDVQDFKFRPVLIVGASPMGYGEDEIILVAMITSKVAKARNGDVEIPNHKAVGLTEPSIIKARRLVSRGTNHFDNPSKQIGRLDDATFAQVISQIAVLFSP